MLDLWTLNARSYYNDLMIFCESLATWLEPGERVEADDGYLGKAPLQIKCLKSLTQSVERKEMAKWVRKLSRNC